MSNSLEQRLAEPILRRLLPTLPAPGCDLWRYFAGFLWAAVVTAVLVADASWQTGLLLLGTVASELLSAKHYGRAITLAGLLAAFAVFYEGLGTGLAIVATSVLLGDGVLRNRPVRLVMWNSFLFGLMVLAGSVVAGALNGLEVPAIGRAAVAMTWLAIFSVWVTTRLRGQVKVVSILPGGVALAIILFAVTATRLSIGTQLGSNPWFNAALDGLHFAGAFMLVDFVAATARARMHSGRAGAAFWTDHLPVLFFRYNGLIITGTLLAHWATVEGDTVLILGLGALLLAQAAYRAYEQANWTSEAAIAALGEAIDARDPYTAGHSLRVADYAQRFATFLGWSHGRVERLRRAALMHDVGKIGVPDAVLFKPGKLDSQEFDQMKRHAPVGESIVSRIPGLESIARIAGEDHEHWSGGGYPRGLKGEEIMPEARLLAIVDVFDAMTTHRPYREALSEEEALLHLESVAGKQLDPRMTERFVEHVRDGRQAGILFCYCATH